MVGPRQSRPPTRRALVILTSLLLAAASVAACGPPAPRVHLGPVPVELFSWEMGRTLAVYVGIDDATLVRGGVGWDTESAPWTSRGRWCCSVIGRRRTTEASRSWRVTHPGWCSTASSSTRS